MMLFALLELAALACTPTTGRVDGFDPWLEDGAGIPTDARLVVLESNAMRLLLTRVDTGEVVPTTVENGVLYAITSEHRVVYVPDEDLAPATTYRIDVAEGWDTGTAGVVSTTFVTGAGPTPSGLAAPVSTLPTAGTWADSDGYYCILGNPIVARSMSAFVTLPADLPPGAYVAYRTAGVDEFDVVLPHDGSETMSIQWEQAQFPEDDQAARDCVVPVVILPNGDELVGDEVCAEYPVVAGPDCGCATGSAPSQVYAVAVVAFLAARRRRA